jgi:hypothetical protein
MKRLRNYYIYYFDVDKQKSEFDIYGSWNWHSYIKAKDPIEALRKWYIYTNANGSIWERKQVWEARLYQKEVEMDDFIKTNTVN